MINHYYQDSLNDVDIYSAFKNLFSLVVNDLMEHICFKNEKKNTPKTLSPFVFGAHAVHSQTKSPILVLPF